MIKLIPWFMIPFLYSCEIEQLHVQKHRFFSPVNDSSLSFLLPNQARSYEIMPLIYVRKTENNLSNWIRDSRLEYSVEVAYRNADGNVIESWARDYKVSCHESDSRLVTDEADRHVRYCLGTVIRESLQDHQGAHTVDVKLSAISDPIQKIQFRMEGVTRIDDYRAGLRWQRLSSVDKYSFLRNTGLTQNKISHVAGRNLAKRVPVALGPSGELDGDFRQSTIYKNVVEENSKRPKYYPYGALLGPEAGAILPIRREKVEVTFNITPLFEEHAGKLLLNICWQKPETQGADNCDHVYTADSLSSTYYFTKGRILLKASHPVYLSARYQVGTDATLQQIDLTSSIQRYVVQKSSSESQVVYQIPTSMRSGKDPLKLTIWSAMETDDSRTSRHYSVVYKDQDGEVIDEIEKKLNIDRSSFDRVIVKDQLRQLSYPGKLVIYPPKGADTVTLYSDHSGDFFIHGVARRSKSAAHLKVYTSGYTEDDVDKRTWIPLVIKDRKEAKKLLLMSYASLINEGKAKKYRRYVNVDPDNRSEGRFFLTLEQKDRQNQSNDGFDSLSKKLKCINSPIDSDLLYGRESLPVIAINKLKRSASLKVYHGETFVRLIQLKPGISEFLIPVNDQFKTSWKVSKSVNLYTADLPIESSEPSLKKRFFYKSIDGRVSYSVVKKTSNQRLLVSVVFPRNIKPKGKLEVRIKSNNKSKTSVFSDYTKPVQVFQIVNDGVNRHIWNIKEGSRESMVVIPVKLKADVPIGEVNIDLKLEGHSKFFISVLADQLKDPFLGKPSRLQSKDCVGSCLTLGASRDF